VAFNTADIQYLNTSVMGDPQLSKLGRGASGGLAGALISKKSKYPKYRKSLGSLILEITKPMLH
jgi:hypothetical protein